ncbi:hypothetical protein NL676_022388 [Syzygium grande]|nr:hypothetical protein NL676_022388 [Syzygium grande]
MRSTNCAKFTKIPGLAIVRSSSHSIYDGCEITQAVLCHHKIKLCCVRRCLQQSAFSGGDPRQEPLSHALSRWLLDATHFFQDIPVGNTLACGASGLETAVEGFGGNETEFLYSSHRSTSVREIYTQFDSIASVFSREECLPKTNRKEFMPSSNGLCADLSPTGAA